MGLTNAPKIKVRQLVLSGATPVRITDPGISVVELRISSSSTYDFTDNDQQAWVTVPANSYEFLPIQDPHLNLWFRGTATLTVVYIGVERLP